MIKLENVTKTYNKTVRALDDISFEVKGGEIVGFIGPNGSGKTTTMKLITGIIRADVGKITVNGMVPYKDRTKNAKNIGVVFGQRSQLWWSLPLIESFKLLKDIYLVKDEDYKKMMDL